MNIPHTDEQNKLPSHNRDAERSVLGSMLRDNGVIGNVTRIVGEADFYHDYHQKIYRGILSLNDKPCPADLVTLAEYLKEQKQVEDIGGYPYLSELWDAAPTAANATHYAGIVRKDAKRRQAIHAANELLRGAWDGSGPPDELIEQTQQVLASINVATNTENKFELNPYDADQLEDADFPLNWLIEDVMVQGEPMVVGGAMKAMKTTMLCAMAVALAGGFPFLNVAPWKIATRRRFLLLSSESGGRVIRETLRRICAFHGTRLRDLKGYLFTQFRQPKMGDPTEMRTLREYLQRKSIEVCAFDPVYLSLLSGRKDDKNTANLFDMGEVYHEVSQTCLGAGATPALAVHANKHVAGVHEPMDIHKLQYAGIGEYMRQWLLTARRGRYDGSGNHPLHLTIGGSAGHSCEVECDIEEGQRTDPGGRHFKATVRSKAESIQQKVEDQGRCRTAKQKTDDAAVLAAIDEIDPHREGVSLRQIRAKTNFGHDKASIIVTRLVDDRILEMSERAGGAGRAAHQKTTYFRRPPLPAADTRPDAQIATEPKLPFGGTA